MFGLLAYPAQGIYKSARAAHSSPAMKAVESGRKAALEQKRHGRAGDKD